MRVIASLALLLGASIWAYAQAPLSGTLTGIVIDESTKETIIGANVILLGTELGTASDFDGFYSIPNVPPGKYTVQISYIGYENLTISDVEVKPGEKLVLDVVLSSSSTLLTEITVVEYRQTNTVQAVLLEVKQAKQVVSGVSSQQIARSQDNNAAQVMSRIPGVTIVDGRFVMIRGLSERYNNVMINNVTAPSTEIDKRTFSFDLIPTSALDRMLIYKSGSADFPGDFAGGVIKLFTLEDVSDNFAKVSVGVGYRANTTLKPYFQSKGSPTDFLGFDSGYRQLPANFPSTDVLKSSARNSVIRRDAAHSLPNNFMPLESVASPDYSLGFSFGKNIDLGGKKLTTINTINYSTSFQHFQRDFYRYLVWEDRTQPILVRFEYNDDSYEKQNRISIMSNWKLRLNNRSRITFKNLINQIGENETVIRNGFDYIQRPDQDVRTHLLGYRSRFIYAGQLEGVHDITTRSSLRWLAGGSFLREIEPDLRRFRQFRPFDQGDQNFIIIDPPSSNLFDTGRYYGDLSEFSTNHALDFSHTLNKKGLVGSVFKTGYAVDYRNRNFDSRYVSFLYPGFFNPDTLRRIGRLPLDKIFANENIRTVDGWVMEEGTRGIDSYDAFSFNSAVYASLETKVAEAINVTAGVRSEYNIQQMRTIDDVIGNLKVNNTVLSILPFFNSTYSISDKSLVRLAYSSTVNRPEFRELAPFVFWDYKLDAGRFGNPRLVPAKIQNVDLRYETYPRAGETFSFGVFYKYFNDPIENKTVITTETPQFTYINANWAQNFGAEIELRKSLRGVTRSTFLDNFSINANASIIRSKVDLGAVAAQDSVRALQGQSPYIVNVALYYEVPTSGFSASLMYNIFGDRIFSVGDVLYPTIYELSRHSLDLTFTKRFAGGISAKFGVQNLLDAPFRFFEDSDRTESISRDKKDNPIFTFRRGQLANLTLTFDLNKR